MEGTAGGLRRKNYESWALDQHRMNPESSMAAQELTPEEGLQGLADLFGKDPVPTCKTERRRYVLEYEDGEPVFRSAEIRSEPVLPPSEFEVAFDEAIKEIFGPDPDGDEIVPHKLAKLFPGSLKMPPS